MLASLKEKPDMQFIIISSSSTPSYSDTTSFDINAKRIVGWKNNHFIMFVSDDSLKMVDYTTESLICGSRYPDKALQDNFGNVYDMYLQYRNRYLPAVQHAWYYFFPKSRDTLFTECFHSIKDTTFASECYKELELDYRAGHIRKNNSEEWEPYYDTVRLYVNRHSRLVEKMTVTNSCFPDETLCHTFLGIRTESQGVTLDSLFDFHHPRYKDYESQNFRTNFSKTYVKKIFLDDSVRQCPLYDIDRKTVCLDGYNRWALLDFWFISCGPCMVFHQQLKKEQDSLGYRILEREGIHIFCINYKSGMTETVRNYAQTYGISDITYTSRDISRHISIPYSPYYYLFSPSGELVYRGVLNYEKLLEAKRQYEKKPKKQVRRAMECENSTY